MWLDPALAPLSRWTELVLLVGRLITGGVMLDYGWPFGTLVLATEFSGGTLMLMGVHIWIAAAAVDFEMTLGTIVKATKWPKP